MGGVEERRPGSGGGSARLATVPAPREAEVALLRIAQEEARPKPLRLEAILGLASRALASSTVQEALLARMSRSGDEEEQVEILRTLRPAVVTPGVLPAIEAWFKTIAAPRKPFGIRSSSRFRSLPRRSRPMLRPRPAGSRPPALRRTFPWGRRGGPARSSSTRKVRDAVKCHVVEGRGGRWARTFSASAAR